MTEQPPPPKPRPEPGTPEARRRTLRVLCPAVLSLEALTVLLAVPLTSDHGWPVTAVTVVVALALLVVAFRVTRTWAVPSGTLLQLAVLSLGLAAPVLAFLAVVFGALWWWALVLVRDA